MAGLAMLVLALIAIAGVLLTARGEDAGERTDRDADAAREIRIPAQRSREPDTAQLEERA